MTKWKKILKEDEQLSTEDYYADDVKNMRNKLVKIEEIIYNTRRRFQQLEAYIKEYIDLIIEYRKLPPEIISLLDVTSGMTYFESGEKLRQEAGKLENEFYDLYDEIFAPVEEIEKITKDD
jgi:hypothetical protein|tara:strand:- start:203 stop:565 length:363 start_codon:yes stop_codon:yes gene_type:complete